MLHRSITLTLASVAVCVSAFVTPRPNHHHHAASFALASTAAIDSPPPLSPLTEWGDQISDIRNLQQKYRQQDIPEFAPEISAKNLNLNDAAAQLAYIEKNADTLKEMLQNHAAIVFRDFELMKSQDGFQEFYKALGMKVCLDPLHSVSARPTVDGTKNSPVYEAVNKESRKNFFIGKLIKIQSQLLVEFGAIYVSYPVISLLFCIVTGMHNEFVGTRAPRAAAFVCFKAAEKGGEFLIADGRRMFRDLDPDLVEELYNRQIRYSVMELPFFGWVDNLPEFLQAPVMGVLKGVVSAAINAKVDFDVELLWEQGGYDSTRMLQARAPSQPPIVAHPVTGEPTWFCNVHSHSSKLRKDREAL